MEMSIFFRWFKFNFFFFPFQNSGQILGPFFKNKSKDVWKIHKESYY